MIFLDWKLLFTPLEGSFLPACGLVASSSLLSLLVGIIIIPLHVVRFWGGDGKKINFFCCCCCENLTFFWWNKPWKVWSNTRVTAPPEQILIHTHKHILSRSYNNRAEGKVLLEDRERHSDRHLKHVEGIKKHFSGAPCAAHRKTIGPIDSSSEETNSQCPEHNPQTFCTPPWNEQPLDDEPSLKQTDIKGSFWTKEGKRYSLLLY